MPEASTAFVFLSFALPCQATGQYPLCEWLIPPTAEDLTARGAKQTALHERAVGATRVQIFGRQRLCARGCRGFKLLPRELLPTAACAATTVTLARARARHDELAELLIQHRPAAVTDVNIQAGEDPVAVREIVLPLVRHVAARNRSRHQRLSRHAGLRRIYDDLKAAGASDLYYEVRNRRRAAIRIRFKLPGNLDGTSEATSGGSPANGWNVSSGFIAGLPGPGDVGLVEQPAGWRGELPLHGCSVSPVCARRMTPRLPPPRPATWKPTLNCMAVLRLMRPDWVIPAVSALNLAQTGTATAAVCALAPTW